MIKGIKRKDIENCAVCGNGLMHEAMPIFAKFKVTRYIIDRNELQRESGLEQFFGGGQQGAALASVMGTDPEIAKGIDESEVLVCGGCLQKPLPLYFFLQEDDDASTGTDHAQASN